jgi:oligopeptide/dipeptide ABC transporter ATP-binding protein
MTTRSNHLLELEHVTVEFPTRSGIVKVLDRVSLTVDAGTTVAVVGESGSGKSTLARAIIGTLSVVGARLTSGRIRLRGQEIAPHAAVGGQRYRGREIAFVPQDPLSALNPVMRVGPQVAEPLRIHTRCSRREARAAAIDLLAQVDVPEPERVARSYPHQLSGGLRQRAMLAMAMSTRPSVLVADEPTTGLDSTIRAQILDVLVARQAQTGMALVVVTHDLGVARAIADCVVVMYAGRVVEVAEAAHFEARSLHPYSIALLQSIPRLSGDHTVVEPIPGSPPSFVNLPSGCAFHPRCPHAFTRCGVETPQLRAGKAGSGLLACHLTDR